MRLRSCLSLLVAVAALGYVGRHEYDASVNRHQLAVIEGMTLVSAPAR